MELHNLRASSPSPSQSQPTPPYSPSPSRLPQPHSPSRTHHHHLFLLISSLYLGTFLVALDTTILGTVLPALTTTFHSLDDLAWYGSAYLLTLTALQPTFGKLYKVLDTKGLYLASIVAFEVGSTLCAAAPSSLVFIVGRAVAGCGAAGLMQGSFAIITKTVPLSQRPIYFGLFVSAFAVNIGIGPVLGGTLADRGMWRWCFWINLPLGAVVFLLVVVFLKLPVVNGKGTPRARKVMEFIRELDLGGALLLITSLTCLFMAMQWGGQKLPWNSAKVIGLLSCSSILLLLFVYVDFKMGDDASVPFRVLKQQSIATGCIYLFFFAMPNFSYGVYIPMFFQAVRGFTAQRSGAEILFLAMTQILTVVVVGALVSRSGYYTPYIIGGTAVSVIGSALITQLDIDTTHVVWALYFILCGVGTGCAINLPYTAVSAVLEEADMVTGNALLQFAFQLGGAISLCISQTIFLSKLTVMVETPLPDIPANTIVDAGAAGLTTVFSDFGSRYQLHLVREAYQWAIKDVFFFLLAAGGLALFVSFGFEHKNVKIVERERNRMKEGVVRIAEGA